MDQLKKIRLAANGFYNVGLERAKIRDLTGAAEALKKCLMLNKYHIDARNLLGLIYYEMGEVSDALVQWVISMNFKEQDNRADYYLDQIQRKPERLDVVSQNVKRYNQALLQAQAGDDDLAVLQLTKVVEVNPNFTKAGKSLMRVLKIDKNNPKASWYMSIVKARTGRADVERRKLKNAFSHKKMQDDDVIIPPSYKENTGWQSILNIVAGLALGAMVIFFLVMPTRIKALNNEHNQEILRYEEKMNQRNEEIDSLNGQMAQAQSDKETAEQKLDEALNSNDSQVNQYAILVKMLQAYRNNDLTGAVTLYPGFNPSIFTDEEVLAIANGIKQDIETNGYQTLEDLAYTMWSAGRMDDALNYYNTCLTIRPDNPNVLFNMGMIYRSKQDFAKAVELFTQVSTQYGDSEYAEKARNQLTELAPYVQSAAGQQPAAGETQAAGESEAQTAAE